MLNLKFEDKNQTTVIVQRNRMDIFLCFFFWEMDIFLCEPKQSGWGTWWAQAREEKL
jgi:hypothetical protein